MSQVYTLFICSSPVLFRDESISDRALPTMSSSFEYLLPPSWKTQVTDWLKEDAPSFDYGGYVVGEAHREAFLLGKGNNVAVLAGSPFFTEIFAQLGCECICNFSPFRA